jgi:protein CpxP
MAAALFTQLYPPAVSRTPAARILCTPHYTRSLSMTTPSRAFFPTAARLFGGAVLVAALGSATLTAWAQGGPGGPGIHGGPGMHGGPAMMGLPMQGRMLDRMLDSVNATADQRTQIKQIAAAAAADLKGQRDAGRALHQQAATLFAQPVVDAKAAEALRQQMLAQHDKASSRMLQAMLEVSGVLTPEQRKTLADRMAQRRDMMQRHWQERQQLEGAAPTKK